MALVNANQATTVFTAPDVSSASQLSFCLTVTDDGGLTDQDDVIITVVNENVAILEFYNPTCAGCHHSGTFGAPRALSSDWDALVPSGINALVNSVEHGLGFMPAGGHCGSLTRDDFAALIS